jgi:hypothetical protein
MSLLAKLWDQGYLTLFNSNNLGSKYAFTLDDAELGKDFAVSSKDELIKLRAKLSIARFMPEREQLITYIMKKFDERMTNGQAIGDIADVFGKAIDENKVNTAVLTYLNQQGKISQELTDLVKSLTQHERFVMLQYISLMNMRNNQSSAQQYQQAVNQNIIGQSIG